MFKDPISIKGQKPMDKPKDGKNSPWDYRCPQYDQRSSVFVNAGTDYAVGHANPIGNTGNGMNSAATLPTTSRAFSVSDKDR